MQPISFASRLRTLSLPLRFAEELTAKVRRLIRAGTNNNSPTSRADAAREPRGVQDTSGSAARPARRGWVSLVGCGPGDPELLTLRALRVLQSADVVVYDHLVSHEVLRLVRPGAKQIYAGKERDNHSLPQERINAMLAELALGGLHVARLKGGDPFVFGRGGEELEALARKAVRVEVVPGITAACGIAASTGVPLTHREHAHSCVFVTGHLKDGGMDLDWEMLARPKQTVVVYMGLMGLPILAGKLIEHGLSPRTPAMMVARGTLAEQEVVIAPLAELARAALDKHLAPPTLIVIGDVVRVRESSRAAVANRAEVEARTASAD
jgi:uroporphyrin-III C-methyltransferase/precorrin-2 dehydrogenase/sirohydrochlorin ferrochelatase